MNLREWALPVYTILMQLAVGALFVLWVIRFFAASKFSPLEIQQVIRNQILVIIFTAGVAMVGAHFHLSKPFHSFMAMLNFKSSWLSREIVFSLIFILLMIGLLYLTYFEPHRRKLITGLGWLAILIGFVLIYCMARIYLIPTQVAWNSTSVIISFYLTALTLGGMAIACLMVLDLKFAEVQKANDVELRAEVIKYCFAGLTILTTVMVIFSFVVVYFQILLLSQGDVIARTSLSLLVDLYMPLFVMRLTFLLYASLSLGVAVYRMYKLRVTPQGMMMPVYLSCLMILIGEIVGRFLFYATHIRVGL